MKVVIYHKGKRILVPMKAEPIWNALTVVGVEE